MNHQPDDIAPLLERAVTTLRGVAHPHRLHILLLLCDGQRTPGELARMIAADPTAVAHHLRCLLDARLIRRQRHGRNILYRLQGEAIRHLVGEVLDHAARST
ncbi:ArsR family transcriptional regulator [Krasilnikovia cinnamomea]|uniref:ArsR family transcriptional regulator n=1 Tax=Krasilnikovia cinnamomea TaxID=349313 RepID=A0A4Q7ZSF2_9ACTN|nr:metalloregulator ArsR/SmtB family transcription factor [Krasilnikovia cinnamomea]RZU53435.1 ArsR family transcriptional regulator [Krasilnikovia cinnamomea]